jgi:hypothetical protein
MRTTKYVLFGALGIGAILLLTSERARKLRMQLDDKARENADLLKDKLWLFNGSAGHTIAELRELLKDEVEGLGDDARAKIEQILNKASAKTNGLKKDLVKKLA